MHYCKSTATISQQRDTLTTVMHYYTLQAALALRVNGLHDSYKFYTINSTNVTQIHKWAKTATQFWCMHYDMRCEMSIMPKAHKIN